MHGWMALGLALVPTDCAPDNGSAWAQADARSQLVEILTVAVLPGPGTEHIGQPLGFGDWRITTVLSNSPDEAVASVLGAGVAYATPVLTGIDGARVIPTRDILIALTGERDNVWRDIGDELAAVGVPAVLSAPWAAFDIYRLRTLAMRGDDVLELADRISAIHGVALAEPDMVFTGRSAYTPNDPYAPLLWGIHNTGQTGGLPGMDMDGAEAWDITIGNASIVTVVIDSGIDQDHPDLHQLPGIDLVGGDRDGGPVNECDNHGTPVAGCISAIIDNNRGVVGIAPGSLVISARAFVSSLDCDGSWTTQTSATIDALDFAAAIGAKVTNNSNTYGYPSEAIAYAYESARESGVIHFASTGNDASSTITYPASLPSVNAIGAINKFGEKAPFSNTGPELFMAAPGVEILTTDRRGMSGWATGDTVYASGTSFASAYAAGVAALVISVNPSLPVAKVERILADTATDLGTPGPDDSFGWGLINAHSAVEAAFAMARCRYDLVPPYGVLDLSDLLAFIVAFEDESPIADFAEPFGVLDLMDLFVYASGFHGGCL